MTGGGKVHAWYPDSTDPRETMCGIRKAESPKLRATWNDQLTSCKQCENRMRKFPQLRARLRAMRQPDLPGVT